MSTGSTRDLSGTRIARYEVNSRLGKGGMGEVWKARDPLLDRTVALKLLPPDLAPDPKTVRRFLDEGRRQSLLSHPGIAQVFDAGEDGGRLYIAMEWIDGETFASLASRGPLPASRALEFAARVAEALHHAHGRSLIHRDVTSRNIMLDRSERVVLLDFGLSRVPTSRRLTSTGELVGTPAYMSPEVVRGEDAEPRSDLYGLGVVLYELLTGRLPFPGAHPAVALRNHPDDVPPPPSRLNPRLRRAVDQLVLRALERDPRQRFADGQEMASALRRAIPSRSRVRSPLTPLPKNSPPRTARHLLVLPFSDLTQGPLDPVPSRAFAVGLAEFVGASLARSPSLVVLPPRVIGMTECPHGGEADLARSLGADLVLVGSVQREARRIRLHVQLLDMAFGGVAVLLENLDGELDGLFQLEDRLTARVLQSLQLDVGTVESRELAGGSVLHEKYLQALGYLQRRDSEASVDGALQLLGELVRSGHQPGLLRAALGRACQYKYMITRERHWADRALEESEEALRSDPTLPEARIALAQVQRMSGRPGLAVRTLQRILKRRPGDAYAWNQMGIAMRELGSPAQAEESFRRAIGLHPAYWRYHAALGRLLAQLGRLEESAKCFGRVIELTPDNAAGHLNLANVHWLSGDAQRAMDSFHRSIAIRPEAQAYTGLGTVLYFLGRISEAAEMFERGVLLRPHEPRMWGNLGDCYRWMPGMEERSAEALDQAILRVGQLLDVNPKLADERAMLAEWLAKRGRIAESRKALALALRLAPENVNVMARAVRVHLLVGEVPLALHWLAEALQHGHSLEEFQQDPELEPLRKEQEYERILREKVVGIGRTQERPRGVQKGRQTGSRGRRPGRR